MKRNDVLTILVPTFVFVLAWIVLSIYHNIVTSTISEEINMQIVSIPANFNTKTIEKLKTREKVIPIYEISGVSVDTQSPTPTTITVNQIPLSSSPSANQATPGGSLTQ